MIRLTLFLQSLQSNLHSIDLLKLSTLKIQAGQDQRKATKECDLKIFLIKEQRELSQLSKALFCQFIIIPCKVKFIDNTRFMASTLSNPVDILSEGIHKIKCKDRNYFLEYKSLNENLIKYQCSTCHKDYLNKMDEKLKSDL